MPILFDLDGTLTDPKEGITQSIRFALEKMGKPLAPETDLTWCIGPSIWDNMAQLLRTNDQKDIDQAVIYYRERYQAVGMFENEVFPGILPLLESLSTKTPLFVATAKPWFFAEPILKHFNLARFFKKIYGSELNGERTNKADLVAFLIKEEGLENLPLCLIGDRKHDIAGALANRIDPIAIGWGYGSDEELLGAGANRIFKSTDELAAYLLGKPY